MGHREAEREMVARHVREGRRHVERQRAIIDSLERNGRSTKQAVELLNNLETLLRLHEEHLARLEGNL